MPIYKRLKYAMYVLVAATMIVILTLSIAEGFGATPSLDVQGVVSHPAYFLSVFAVGYALAPMLSERVPISGDQPPPTPSAKPPFGYPVRVLALAFLGLALAMFANLVVFLLGKFA